MLSGPCLAADAEWGHRCAVISLTLVTWLVVVDACEYALLRGCVPSVKTERN